MGNRVWGGFADWKNFLGEIQEMGPCGSQPYPWWGQNLLRESDITLPLCLLELPSEYLFRPLSFLVSQPSRSLALIQELTRILGS